MSGKEIVDEAVGLSGRRHHVVEFANADSSFFDRAPDRRRCNKRDFSRVPALKGSCATVTEGSRV
ncbi:hypothetical protein J7E62_30235 [Variovorax paradoxus]|nr:hypothetical protein [Variovorax paradoxus]